MGEKAHVPEELWGLASSASPTLCFAKDGAPALKPLPDATSHCAAATMFHPIFHMSVLTSGNLDRAYQLFLLALGARMLLR
jgi:hypothetical protein